MVDARSSALVTSLPPERVARAEFSTSFRGFDPTEVRAFLARVAGEIRALVAREAELLDELGELERHRSEPLQAEQLDEHRMTELLGAEAAKVLEAAREAANRIRANAQQEADRARDEAMAAAASLRADAEASLEARVAAADDEAARIRAEAEVEAARAHHEADVRLARAEAEAEAVVDQARIEGRRMVAEARQVRERVLTDMARRRNVARQQLERLKAGRDRLAEAVDHVRRAVEETSSELSGSLGEAKAAGERAARLVDVDNVPTAAELETEVIVARDAGLIDHDALARAVARDDSDTNESPVVDMAAAEAAAAPAAAASPLGDVEIEHEASEDVAAVSSEIDVEVERPAVARVAPAPSAGAVEAEEPVVEGLIDDATVDAAAPAGTPADGDAEGAAASDSSGTVSGLTASGEVDAGADTVPPMMPSQPTLGNVAAPADVPEPVEDTPQAPQAGVDVIDLDSIGSTGSPTDEEAQESAETLDLRGADEPVAAGRRGFSSAVDAVFSRLRTSPGDANGSDAAGPARRGAASAGATTDETAPDSPLTAAEPDLAQDHDELALADRLIVHARDAQLAGAARDLARQLKLVLSNEQNVLLELVRERTAEKITASDLAPDLEAAASYAAAARRELNAAAQAGWRSVARGDTPDEVELGPVPEQLGADLAASLRSQVVGALDGNRDRLSDQIRAIYRQARNQRANEYADHAVLAAYTQGQLAAVGSGAVEGGVALVRWVFEACGPDCLDNSLAGQLALGDPFPTGHLHPPASRGCRCLLVHVRT